MNLKKGIAALTGVALIMGAASGCTGQAALEDRTYVESLHIIPEGDGYRYQCTLAYVDSNSMKYLRAGLDGAVMEPGSTEQGKERSSEESGINTEKSGVQRENTEEGAKGAGESMEKEGDITEPMDEPAEGSEQAGESIGNTETGTESNSEGMKQNTEAGEGNAMEGGDRSDGSAGGESREYTATAQNMEEFNQEYNRITGSNFDYSHLQGIYLDASLYQPKRAEEVLNDIWNATQAVLSTPIYQEGLEVGEQKETTLGDWLKEGR